MSFISVNLLQNVHAQFLCYASSAYVVALHIDSTYGYRYNRCINDRHTTVWGMWVSVDACSVDLRRIRRKSVTSLFHRFSICQFSSYNTQNMLSYKNLCVTGEYTAYVQETVRYSVRKFLGTLIEDLGFWTKIQAEPSVPLNFVTIVSTLKGTSDSGMRRWQLQVFTFIPGL